MTKQAQAILLSVMALATMGLANCGKYNCATDDGLSFSGGTCNSSSPSGASSGGTTGSGSVSAFAFAVDEAGTIDGYTLSASGATFGATSGYTAPTIPTDEPGYGMVIAQKKYLYTAFIGTGQIFGWTIGSAGSLTAISGSPFSASYLIGIGSNQGNQDMIVNPAGTLLFIDDVSVQGVYVYSIGSSGALTAVSGSPFSVPFFPGNMTTDGLGKYLYVAADTNGSEIAAYSIGSTGSLTTVPGSPFAYPMLQVQGEPTGDYLIGVKGGSTGDAHLYLFSIAQSGANAGAITQLESVSTVYAPYSIAVQSQTGGDLVYSFSINATDTGYNPTEGYALSSGTLTAVSGSPFSNLSNGYWAQFDQSGQFLFPYSAVEEEGSNTITTQLGVLDVGSGGALTQPISPATLATEGFWAVTDTP